MLPQATTVVAALLLWGGVLCDALLVSVGGGAPSASIERTRASSATIHAAQPARRTSTISAQLQSPPRLRPHLEYLLQPSCRKRTVYRESSALISQNGSMMKVQDYQFIQI